jgi:hypothetical protein
MNKWLAALMIGAIAATFASDADGATPIRWWRQSRPAVGACAATSSHAAGAISRSRLKPHQRRMPRSRLQAHRRLPRGPRVPARGADGLAAGIGIAALAQWLGFGEALSMFLTVMLIGLALMMVAAFVLRRMRGPQPAAAVRATAAPALTRTWDTRRLR